MLTFCRRNSKSWRAARRSRTLPIEPLEERALLAIGGQLESGVLRIGYDEHGQLFTDMDGALTPLPTTSGSGENASAVRITGGIGTQVIEFDQASFSPTQQFVLANGPWIDPLAALEVIQETLGSGWAEKLAIPDSREFLMSGQWREPLANGELAKQLTAAGWGSASDLLNTVIDEVKQRAQVYSVTLVSPQSSEHLAYFNGKLHSSVATSSEEDLPVTSFASEEDVPVTPFTGGEGDDDPPSTPSLFISSSESVVEPTSGDGDIVFLVGTVTSHSAPISFTWNTVNGTAEAGSDFDGVSSGTFTLPGGVSQDYLTVHVHSDVLPEPDETFQVVLSNLTNASAGNTTSTATILDVPTVHINNVSAGEWQSPVSIPLTLSRESSEPIVVTWETRDKSAKHIAPGYGDYDASSGTITFLPGVQSVTLPSITIHNDTTPEDSEQFEIHLTSITGPGFIGDPVATVTIPNDDLNSIAIEDQALLVEENRPIGTSVGFVRADGSLLAPGYRPIWFDIAGGTGTDYFDIDQETGEITVTDPSVLDFEASQTTFTLSVRAFSSHAFSIQQTAEVTITVTDQVPSVPRLDPTSDTGQLGDGITSDSLPTLTGTAEIGDTVDVYVDNVLVGSHLVIDGTYQVALLSALTEGQHFALAQATIGGVTVTSSSALILQVDQTAPNAPSIPAISLASDSGVVGDNLTNVTTPTFFGTAEQGSIIEILCDGVVVGSALSVGGIYQVAVSVLPEGPRLIQALAIDAAGNLGPQSSALSLEIDTQSLPAPPAPALDPASDSGAADNITNVAGPVIIGMATGAVAIRVLDDDVMIGEGAVIDGAYAVAVHRLSAGSHNITVASIDAAGNVSPASSAISVTIVSPPAAPGAPELLAGYDSGHSSSDGVTNNVFPAFTGTADDGTTVKLFVDGVLVGTALTTSGTYTVQVDAGHSLGDGTHIATVKAVDAEGSLSSSSAGASFVVDSTPPAPTAPRLATNSDSGSSDIDGITNVTQPSFVGSVTPGSTVHLFVDGNEVAAEFTASGSYSLAPTIALTGGPHSVTIVETDLAGNTSGVSPAVAITIDTVLPATPSVPQLVQELEKIFIGTAVAGLLVSLYSDGDLVGSGTVDASGNYHIAAKGMRFGSHQITATTTDPLTGSVSIASNAVSVTIQAPRFALSDGGGPLEQFSQIDLGSTSAGRVVTHTFMITNTGTADLSLYEPVLPDGFSIAVSYGSAVLAPTEFTTFTIQLDADEAGTLGGQMVVGSSDSTASPFSITLSGEVISGWIVDDNGVEFNLSADGWDSQEQTDAAAYNGAYHIGNGQVSENPIATWTFDGVEEGSYRVYAHWGARPDAAQTATYEISDGLSSSSQAIVDQTLEPTGLSDSDVTWQLLSGSFVVTSGALSISLSGTGSLLVADAVRIEKTFNHVPTVVTDDDLAAHVDALFSYPIDASDFDGDDLTFGLGDGAPEGADIDGEGLFTWTPTIDQAGTTFNIEVTVSDNGSPSRSTVASIAVTVYSGNQLPVLVPPGDQTINATHELSLQLAAHDPDGPDAALMFVLDDGPTGLSLAANGALIWTPSTNQIGETNPVTVHVEDGNGMSAPYTFNVTVGEDLPLVSIPDVTGIQLVNDTGVVGDNITTDRRVKGSVADANGPLAYTLVQFDVDGNGIADGSVYTQTDGTFEIDLASTLFANGPATIKVRASTATPTGLIYGPWSSATFTFETDPVPTTITTTLQTVLPNDVVSTNFGGATLEPAVAIPTEGDTVAFAGNVAYGAEFANFASRYIGLGTTYDNTTLGNSTTFNPSGGSGQPDVTSTTTLVDHVVSVDLGGGSWTLDETYYYSYLITSVVTGVSTLVQSGLHSFTFHALGNALGASYTLVETRTDGATLYRSTSDTTTDGNGVVHTTGEFVTTNESQGYTLNAVGTAVLNSGQITASTEHHVAAASGGGTYYVKTTESSTDPQWNTFDRVTEDSQKLWSYDYDHWLYNSAGVQTGAETFSYSTDDDIIAQTALSTYTEASSATVGAISTHNNVSRTEQLTGTSSQHYQLAGTRDDFSDETWLAVVDDAFDTDRDYHTTSSESYTSVIDDATPGLVTASKTTFNSSASRDEHWHNHFEGETALLPNSTAVYSGSFDSDSTTDYSWNGSESDQYSGTDTSQTGTTGTFSTDSRSSNSGQQHVAFDVTNGTRSVDAANIQTDAYDSTYVETGHTDSTWDNKDTSDWNIVDTSVPSTISISNSHHVSTDKGSSFTDTTANETFGDAADGTTTSSGSYVITYQGSGDSTDLYDTDVTTDYDASTDTITDASSGQFTSHSSRSTHYDTDGGESITLNNGSNTEYTYDNINESGNMASWSAGSDDSTFEDTTDPLYYKKATVTLSWTDSKLATFTNDLHDDKTVNSDGTWSSHGRVDYDEDGLSYRSVSAGSSSTIDNLTDPLHIRSESATDSTSDIRTGDYGIVQITVANRSAAGVATSTTLFASDDSGTLTSSRNAHGTLSTSDTNAANVTNTAYSDSSSSRSTTGNYSDTRYESAQTNAAGQHTNLSGESSWLQASGPSNYSLTSGSTSSGTVVSGDVTQVFSRSATATESRTGTVTIDNSSSSSTDAAGLYTSTSSDNESVDGTTHSTSSSQSSSTTTSPDRVTGEWGNASIAQNADYSDTRSTDTHVYTDGTSDFSSSAVLDVTNGSTSLSMSSGSLTSQTYNDTTMTSDGDLDLTVTVTKTASTLTTSSESGTGTYSSNTSDVAVVDKSGFSKFTHEETSDSHDNGSAQLSASTSNTYDEDDLLEDFFFFVTLSHTVIDSDSDSSRSSSGTFDRIDHSFKREINDRLVFSDASTSETITGTFSSNENSSNVSTTNNYGIPNAPSHTVVDVDSSFQIPNGSFTDTSNSHSMLFLGGATLSVSNSVNSTAGNSISSSNSLNTESVTDTSAPGVTTTNSTVRTTNANGTGHVDTLDKYSNINGATRESHSRNASSSGTDHRTLDVVNTSNGVPTNFNVPGTNYTTNTASSSFIQSTLEDATYDSTSSTTSTVVAGAITTSSNVEHYHENVGVTFSEDQLSDTNEVGTTQTGTPFDNKQHFDSDSDETWDEENTTDDTETLGAGTTSKSVSDLTGGSGTYTSNSTDNRTETSISGGYAIIVTTDNFSKDDLTSTFSGHIDQTNDVADDGTVTATYNENNSVTNTPGASFGHQDQAKTSKTVIAATNGDTGSVSHELTRENSITETVTKLISGVGVDQGTITTTSFNGTGKNYELDVKSASTYYHATPSVGYEVTVTRTESTNDSTTSDYVVTGATKEYVDAATSGFTEANGTLTEHISSKHSIETNEKAKQDTNSGGYVVEWDSTWGSSTGTDSDKTTTSTLDPLTHEITKAPVVTNSINTDEQYATGSGSTEEHEDLGNRYDNSDTWESEQRSGHKGLDYYRLFRLDSTWDDTTTATSGGVSTSKGYSKLYKDWLDEAGIDRQTYHYTNEQNSDTTNTISNPHKTTHGYSFEDTKYVTLHLGTTVYQTQDTQKNSDSTESDVHTLPPWTYDDSTDHDSTEHAEVSQLFGEPVSADAYTYTASVDDWSEYSPDQNKYITQSTSSGSVGSTPGTFVQTLSGVQGWVNNPQPINSTPGVGLAAIVTTPMTAVFWGSSSGPYYSNLTVDDTLTALAGGSSAETDSFLESISSYISEGINEAIDQLAADPVRYVAGVLSPIPGLGEAAVDISRSLVESAWNAVADDFTNLQDAGYGNLAAAIITAGDLAGRLAGLDSLENFSEGRNREGEHLTNLQAYGHLALGSVQLATVFVPAFKIGTAVATAGVARLGAGRIAGGLIEAELVEASASSSALSAKQASSFAKFVKKLPSAAEESIVHNLPGGGKAFASNVPGKVPGSFAQYLKQVGPDGKTILYYKTTFDRSGVIVHVKDKLDGFTWLREMFLP